MMPDAFDPKRMMDWFQRPQAAPEGESSDEVDELRRRLAEMEQRLEELSRKRDGDEP